MTARAVRLSVEPMITVQFLFGPNDHLKSCVYLKLCGQLLQDAPTTCLRAVGIRFFQIRHKSSLYKIIEASATRVNQYENHMALARRPQNKGALGRLQAP